MFTKKMSSTLSESDIYPFQSMGDEVDVPINSEDMFADPNTSLFQCSIEEWDRGPLPFATEEARSVAHMLQCTPLQHKDATKSAVMAEIGRAKMIHLATHGSAGGVFLVLGTANRSLGTAFRHTVDDPDTLLLKASEVEFMDIPAALVVLSSCDTGCGVIMGDDMQVMAHSFLLAGARTVLMSLWKAPDESSSFFMQYFYRYLLDGRKAGEELQKASLSIRCFAKYSDFVHWSGHRLTGQDVTITHELSSQDRAVQVALGRVELVGTEQQLDSDCITPLVTSPFPRLCVIHKIVEDLANINSLQTDVQLLCGPPGVDLMEPVMDYICSHHTHYSGGIVWLPVCAVPVMDCSKVLKAISQCSRNGRILVVVDCSDDITSISNLSHSLLHSHNTDVIIITHWLADNAKQHVKRSLKRPVSVCKVPPLTVSHTTQRLVYSVQSNHYLPPSQENQTAFQQLAHLSTGSPVLVRLIQSLLHHHIECSGTASDGLQNCSNEIEEIVDMLYDDDDDDEFLFKVHSLVTTICDTLSTSSQRLLLCLSCLDGMPVSQELMHKLLALISPHQPDVMITELGQAAVLLGYPSPVVCGLPNSERSLFFYVPQTIAEAVWSNSSIHNKCLSLLLMKQVVMTVHQPHTACLCHRVIQALETTMICDCQEQNTVIVMGLKDSVRELTEHYVSITPTNSSLDYSLDKFCNLIG